MGKLKRLLGYSAFLGDKKELDVLLGRKDMYENQIKKRFGNWEECQACLPSIDEAITRVREKIRREEN